MKIVTTVILMIILISQQPAFAKKNLQGNLQEPEIARINEFFDAYMAKYNHYLTTNEFKEAPYLYHDTIMVMSSSVAPYTIDSSTFYQRTKSFLDNLKKQGVRRIDWINVNVRIIDKNLAVASNTAARLLENGDEFNRVGVTYLMRKNNNEWRITSFTVHNADGVIKL